MVKFSISTLVSIYMCKMLWENNIYEAELYQVALRYRSKYDKIYRDKYLSGDE
jgi:hypothetical protein